jgi:Sec1-binding region of Mso1
MSSYLTTLLTTTSSRYASLRSLLPSNSETDGDTEDDTHICRVLRAYYLEKGRPFPTWLPPDPKGPQPAIQPIYSTNAPIGAGYGGLSSGPGGASKLGSLWDPQPPTQQNVGPPSLRQAGGRGASSQVLRGGWADNSRSSPEPTVQARPLPSQLAGSYQNSSTTTPPGSAGAGAGSAQDRLKARLRGAARGGNPSGGAATQPQGGFASNTGPGSNAGYGGGYDDRGGRDSGRSRAGGGDRPFVAATSPWATNEAEFSGSGYSSGSGGGGPMSGDSYGDGGRQPMRVGLPSGPASGRRGGLPTARGL